MFILKSIQINKYKIGSNEFYSNTKTRFTIKHKNMKLKYITYIYKIHYEMHIHLVKATYTTC